MVISHSYVKLPRVYIYIFHTKKIPLHLWKLGSQWFYAPGIAAGMQNTGWSPWVHPTFGPVRSVFFQCLMFFFGWNHISKELVLLMIFPWTCWNFDDGWIHLDSKFSPASSCLWGRLRGARGEMVILSYSEGNMKHYPSWLPDDQYWICLSGLSKGIFMLGEGVTAPSENQDSTWSNSPWKLMNRWTSFCGARQLPQPPKHMLSDLHSPQWCAPSVRCAHSATLSAACSES